MYSVPKKVVSISNVDILLINFDCSIVTLTSDLFMTMYVK